MCLEEIFPEYTPYISVSVLADNILGYNAEMFQVADREEACHTCRSYFVSFIVPLDQNEPDVIVALGDGWLPAHFDVLSADKNDNRPSVELTKIPEPASSPVNYIDQKFLIFRDTTSSLSVLGKINHTNDPSLFVCTDSFDIK